MDKNREIERLKKEIAELYEDHDEAWDRMNQGSPEEAVEEDEYIGRICREQSLLIDKLRELEKEV